MSHFVAPPPPLHQASSNMGDEVGREKIEGSKMFSFQKVMWWIRIFVVNPNFCGGSNIRCSRSEFLCLGSGSTALGNQSPFKLKIQKRKTVGMCNLNASLIFPKSHWLLPSPPLSLYGQCGHCGQGGGGGGCNGFLGKISQIWCHVFYSTLQCVPLHPPPILDLKI